MIQDLPKIFQGLNSIPKVRTFLIENKQEILDKATNEIHDSEAKNNPSWNQSHHPDITEELLTIWDEQLS